MQLILQEDVINIGKAGDVVDVQEGFGRNFLLPRKKAVLADPKNLTMLEHQKRVVAARQQKLKVESESLAIKLQALSLTISREEGEAEKIFGSVTAKDIAEALRHAGFVVDRHDIKLEEPLRELGGYEVQIKLPAQVMATIKVSVVKK